MDDKEIIKGNLVKEIKESEIEEAKHKATVIAEFAKVLKEADVGDELIYDVVMYEFYDSQSDIIWSWE